MEKIAIVGAGLVGRAWAVVFARAGLPVAMWDRDPAAAPAALDFIAARLPELRAAGLLADTPEAVLARVTPVATLAEALDGAVHVQESGPERVEAKQALFAELDAAAAAETVLASSSSGIPASAFTEGLPGRARCLIAHPVNPPYLIPLVELCPAPWTAAETVARTRALMTRVGQVPVALTREVNGFALNRLQIALVSEAFRLAMDGVMSPEDLDATVKDGLGLRWSFMGPFETIDLNAPGGLADYCARYGALYNEVQREMTPRELTPESVGAIHAAQRRHLPLAEQAARQVWRDRRLMGLLAHKAKLA